MKLKTLTVAILLASSALLTSCGGSSDDESDTTTVTYYSTVDDLTFTVTPLSLDDYTYTAQIVSISNCNATYTDTDSGTESGTCTFALRLKNDSGDTAITYSTASANYDYVATTGQLKISNVSYEIDSTSTEVTGISLTVNKYSDTSAIVTPNSSVVVGSISYDIYYQTMTVTE